MADVFVHVGLPKTGTTTIQGALEARVGALAEAGVLFPTWSHRGQRLAAYDLVGQRVKGDDSQVVAGAFARLLTEMEGFSGRSIVVSEEELGLARPHHVRKIVRGLPDHRIFVVIGLRDIARNVVSAWQQAVLMGSTTQWQRFIEGVREPGRGDVALGAGFWVRQDPMRVIDAWSTQVPVERIRVVTVPPSGADSSTLLERFAAATELPIPLWNSDEVIELNVSLGAAGTELIRRLNESVVGPLNAHQYRHVVQHGIRHGLKVADPRPLRLPAEHLPWARDYGQKLVAELQRRGILVFGDLADLVPRETKTGSGQLDEVSEAELLCAAEAALASLAIAHGRLFRRYRRAFFERHRRFPSTTELLGSAARVTGFRLQRVALKRVGNSRTLTRAADKYLRRNVWSSEH